MDALKEWIGTNLEVFKNRAVSSELQTIEKIEAGGFRYFSVPIEWIKDGNIRIQAFLFSFHLMPFKVFIC